MDMKPKRKTAVYSLRVVPFGYDGLKFVACCEKCQALYEISRVFNDPRNYLYCPYCTDNGLNYVKD